MRKVLLSLSLMVLSALSFSQVINETFTSGLPAGWTSTFSNDTSWVFNNPSGRTISGTGFDANFAIIDSDNRGNGKTQHSFLTTNSFSTTGNNVVILKFAESYRTCCGSTGYTKVSTDGGTTWDTVGTNTSSSVGYPNPTSFTSIDISAEAGNSASVMIEWDYQGSYDWWWAIDSVVVEASSVMCLDPSSQTTSNKTPTSIDLGWTENNSATEWEIEWGPTGFTQGTGLPFGVATNPQTSLTGLMANTSYDWYVRTVCAPGDTSGWTGPNTFFTGYCTPAPSSTDGDGITNVTFGAVNNTGPISGGTEPGYGDYSSLVGDIAQNTVASVDITYETGYTYVTEIWIDWNDDLDFDDAGENVYSGVSASANPTTLNATFNVPLSAPLGQHRMRIGGADTGPPTTCYTGTWGSYEDYTVNVIAPPSCLPPSMQLASSVAATSATVNWTENGTATQWEVEYGAGGFTLGTGTSVIVNTDTFLTLNSLMPSSSYDWYVRAICAAGDTSAFSTAASFQTGFQVATGVNCTTGNPNTVFSEEFDNNNAGWTGDLGSAGGDWEIPDGSGSSFTGASSAHSGANFMNFEASSSPSTGGSVVSPAIDLTAGADEVELSFWLHAYGSDMGDLSVGVGTSATGPFTTVVSTSGQIQTADTDPWQNVGVDLTAYLGQIIYLEFNISNVAGYRSDMSIDLVEVTTCLSCTGPSSNPVGTVTATTADLSWIENGTATQWEVEYGLTGFAFGAGTSVIVNTDTFTTLTGLSPASDYDYYVRAICSPGDTSNRVNGVFTTLCPPTIMAPYMQNFDGLALTSPYTAMPNCWPAQTGPDYWDVTNDITNTGHTYLPNIGDHTTGSSNYMWIDASSDITANEMVTPDIDISGLTSPYAGFWFASNNTTNNINHTIALDAWDGSAWVNIVSTSGNFATWIEVAGAVPASIPNVTRFRIYAIADPAGNSSTYYFNDLGVDDFFIGEAPSCPATSNHSTFNITAFDADVAWTENGPATNWELEWDLAGYTVGTASNSMIVTNDTFSITGLMPVTNYEWSVRAVCGPADSSTWSPKSSFSTPVTCPAPSALSNTAISSTEMQLDWTNNSSATDFEIEWGAAGFSQGSGTSFITSKNPDTLAMLMPNTAYSWYVRAICTPGDSSTWSGPNNFTTPCATVVAPFFDGFENHATLSGLDGVYNCWTATRQNTTNDWNVDASGSTPSSGTGPSGPYAGSKYIFFEASGGAADAEASFISPTVDISGLTVPVVEFYYHMFGDNRGGMGTLYVDVIDGATTTTIDSLVNEQQFSMSDPWLRRQLNLPSVSGPIRVALRAKRGSLTQYGDIAIDDFAIFDKCAVPFMAPFKESFTTNSGTNAPDCWTQAATTGGPWQFNVSALPDFGSNVAMPDRTNGTPGAYGWVDMSSNDAGVLLTTPIIDVSALTVPELSFWIVSHNNDATVSVYNKIYVEAFDGTSFVAIDSIQGDFGLKWEYFSYDLSADTFNTNFVQIQFRAESGGDANDFNNDMLLDEVQVKEFTTCPFPDQLSTSGVTADSAILAWTENGTATQWEISYGPTPTMPGAGTSIITNNNPDTLTGLMSATSYDVYVRSICGAGDSSDWSAITSFATLCNAFSVPYTENFDGVATPGLPTCWSELAAASVDIQTVTSTDHGVPIPSSPNAIEFNVGTGTGAILVTPQLAGLSTGLNQIRAKFAFEGGTTGTNDLMVVGTLSDPTNAATFTPYDTLEGNVIGPGFLEFVIRFDRTSVFGTDSTIGFMNINTGGGWEFFMDDFVYEAIPPNNIGITEVIRPNSGCSMMDTVEVLVENFGTASQSNFQLGYSVNGTAITPETFTGTLAAGGTATYVFTTLANVSATNSTIDAYTLLVSDSDNSNDTASTSIVNVGSVSSFPYNESFESGAAGWAVDGSGSSWALGAPSAILINSASNGTQAWVTNPAGNYSDNEFGWVLSPCLDFTNVMNPYISLDIWYDIESQWDGAIMQASSDGGLTWSTVGMQGNPVNWYNDTAAVIASTGVDPTGQGWTGDGTGGILGSGGWVTAMHALDNLGGEPQVNVRIMFLSDANTIAEGMAFDNVTIFDSIPADPYYPIGTINTEDATTGVADSLNVTCWTSGTVVGIDLDGNNGISFYIIDQSSGSQEGINVFNFNDVSNYVVNEGDSILVHGDIIQFNGLTEINPDSISVISTGNAIPTPIVVTNLDESTEARYLSIPTNYWSLSTSGSGSSNVTLTNGTDTIVMRIDSDTDINDSLNASNAIVPGDTICGLFGVGGQFDSSNPYTDGYQIFPMRWSDLTICRNTISIEESGVTSKLDIFPNPTNSIITLNYSGFNSDRVKIEIMDISGRVIKEELILNATQANRMDLDLSDLSNGVYFLSIQDGENRKVEKIIKN